MIAKHDPVVPDTCDVCKYAVEHVLDSLVEHTMTQAATVFLLEDLEASSAPLPLGSIAVSSIGVEPGPVHPFEPRHWFWALMTEDDIVLSLRGASRGAAHGSI